MVFLFLFLVYFCILQQSEILVEAKKKREPYLQEGVFPRQTFTIIPAFSDEFNSRLQFNLRKWYDTNPRWLGRQPGLFSSTNVRQRKGQLQLRGKYEDDPLIFTNAPEGYINFTTAFVMTRKRARYGYIEVSAKPGKSKLSSAFWASLDTPDRWTEIDMFEIGGGADQPHKNRVYTNVHVFRDKWKGINVGTNEISKPSFYEHSEPLSKKFHVYAIDWSKKYITWLFDGRPIRKIRNTHWKQGLPLKLDVETMPYWFGLPTRKRLPATFKIKYIRAWSRRSKVQENSDGNDTLVQQNEQRMFSLSALNNVSQNGGGEQISDFPFGGGGLFGMQTRSEPSSANQDNSIGDKNEENEEKKDKIVQEDDDAIMEVEDHDIIESMVRREWLQRLPIVGSNEAVYQPVRPPKGSTWRNEIMKINGQLTDVISSLPGGISN